MHIPQNAAHGHEMFQSSPFPENGDARPSAQQGRGSSSKERKRETRDTNAHALNECLFY